MESSFFSSCKTIILQEKRTMTVKRQRGLKITFDDEESFLISAPDIFGVLIIISLLHGCA